MVQGTGLVAGGPLRRYLRATTIEDVSAVCWRTFVTGWKGVALFGGGSAVFFLQLLHPVVLFKWPAVNVVAGLAAGLCLPWLTLIAIFRVGRWWSKAIALAAVIPLLVYSAAFLLGFCIAADADDQFADLDWKGTHVRFYRTDYGAISDWGVVIRQERLLLPGLVMVRRLDVFSTCFALKAEGTDRGIKVNDPRSECSDLHAGSREYRLKPFLYF